MDETPAEGVVFLLGTYREGIEQESAGVASVGQRSRKKVGVAVLT
jgi:hypothetical protein